MCGSVARSGARLIGPTGNVVPRRSATRSSAVIVRVHAAISTSSESWCSERASCVARSREVGPSHRVAQSREHRVGVAGDHDVAAVERRVRVRGRDVAQHAAGAGPRHARELVVGDRRLHQRHHRLVDRDVDLLPRPLRVRSFSAASVPTTAKRPASESPIDTPVRAGGRSGSPVVWRMPPIASPIEPKPGSARAGRSGRSPRRARGRRRVVAASVA